FRRRHENGAHTVHSWVPAEKKRNFSFVVCLQNSLLRESGCICLVANPRHQAPKSATHRLGWLWNSNAYAIRGHRKILSSGQCLSYENQQVRACPRRSDIASHYE